MIETATFAGGCFWCLEAVFQNLRGIESVTSGYMGGSLEQPTYRQVCNGDTGHAEVVQIRFDPAIIDYTTLLEVFFALHDPTTLNRQGNDVGTQYRSAIFCHSAEQTACARATLAAQTKLWSTPLVTEITAATTFWPAESFHNDYYRLNPDQAYCAAIIAPKVKKILHHFSRLC